MDLQGNLALTKGALMKRFILIAITFLAAPAFAWEPDKNDKDELSAAKAILEASGNVCDIRFKLCPARLSDEVRPCKPCD